MIVELFIHCEIAVCPPAHIDIVRLLTFSSCVCELFRDSCLGGSSNIGLSYRLVFKRLHVAPLYKSFTPYSSALML